ncbi:hypothetical protein [Prevotella sp.]
MVKSKKIIAYVDYQTALTAINKRLSCYGREPFLPLKGGSLR